MIRDNKRTESLERVERGVHTMIDDYRITTIPSNDEGNDEGNNADLQG